MKTIVKYAAAATMVGALALAAATPSQARWHGAGYAAAGFAAGALVGAAAASNNYYGPGYYDPYAAGYAYAPGPYYAPAPAYYAPAPAYYSGPAYRRGGCWHDTDSTRGFGYYGAC